MARNRSNGNNKFAKGALFGGLVAGITALLFAPKSGEKMRKELKRKCCDVSEKACDIFDDVCKQSQDLAEKAKDIACCAKEAAQRIYRPND